MRTGKNAYPGQLGGQRGSNQLKTWQKCWTELYFDQKARQERWSELQFDNKT